MKAPKGIAVKVDMWWRLPLYKGHSTGKKHLLPF